MPAADTRADSPDLPAPAAQRTRAAVPDACQKWSGGVNEVTIGATPDEGGTRGGTVTVGGAKGVPFVGFDGPTPNPPVIAVDVLDAAPEGWPPALAGVYADVWSDPAAWARRAVGLGADLVNLRLEGTHPDSGDRTPEEAVETVKAVLAAVSVPLIVWGCDVPGKDRLVMPKVAEAAEGENCLLGAATETEYRTITAAAQAYGHKLVALAPCDVNKQKQVSILVSDTGYPLENLVLCPTTAALGYGMEYIYSILERGRLAALSGDGFLAQPVILDVGAEAWRAKESKAEGEFEDAWGPASERGPVWEAVTATSYLQAGADILVMRHPKAMETVRRAIRALNDA
jgi:acetyl-CoA decarbonylase/synthase complex subunit delta